MACLFRKPIDVELYLIRFLKVWRKDLRNYSNGRGKPRLL